MSSPTDQRKRVKAGAANAPHMTSMVLRAPPVTPASALDDTELNLHPETEVGEVKR